MKQVQIIQLSRRMLGQIKSRLIAWLASVGQFNFANWVVKELKIAKDKKTTQIGETLIKPAAVSISQIMHGDMIADEVKQTLLSADTIRRRISEMSQDINYQLNDRVER